MPPVENSESDVSEVVSDFITLYLYRQYLVRILVSHCSAVTELLSQVAHIYSINKEWGSTKTTTVGQFPVKSIITLCGEKESASTTSSFPSYVEELATKQRQAGSVQNVASHVRGNGVRGRSEVE